jgi:bifunctional DNA-binding transcriptional regulator/antitoxin component of YhaV-PrlF toxin-antitoxin module
MSSYILEIQEDDDGELFIVFPDEIIEDLGWQEGDVLNWDVKGEGIILSKVSDPAGYVVLEE